MAPAAAPAGTLESHRALQGQAGCSGDASSHPEVVTPAPLGWPDPQGMAGSQLVLPACNAAPHPPRQAPAGVQAVQAAPVLMPMVLDHNQPCPKRRAKHHGNAWSRLGCILNFHFEFPL